MREYELHGVGMTSLRTRKRLINRLRRSGIQDERVLDAIEKVPRHLFIDEAISSRAYDDTALPIGHRQTISQPYVVARMAEAVASIGAQRILEIGTGSGYQAAVLAVLIPEVFSVERIQALFDRSRKLLKSLGINNVYQRYGDGTQGWRTHAPYDATMVTAATSILPEALVAQTKDGGRLIIPIGGPTVQELVMYDKTGLTINRTVLDGVRFVPLVEGTV